MKKLLIVGIMLIALIGTIYTLFIWEPKGSRNEVIQNTINEVQSRRNSDNSDIDDLSRNNEVDDVPTINKSIFKIEKSLIEKNINKDDMVIVNNIIKKMSTVDIGKIEEVIQYEDEEEGVREAFKVLKKRLTTEDYQVLENILGQFIDFSIIGQEA
ncbi:hypothetical protein ACQPU1_04945 [Clostridium paraputrificum]|uniref:hypothetical protein n=1 Tax=Clostridium TaxID=1485 RepID=UPI003D326C9B